MLVSILLVVPAFSLLSSAASINARANSCGVRGFDKSNAYSYDGSGASSSLSACGAKCTADKKCKSFGVGGTQCLLYTKTVASNVKVDASSPYLFYDVGCAVPVSTSSTSSSSISSTSASLSSSTNSINSTTSTTVTASSVSTTATTTSSSSPSPTSSQLCGASGYDLGTSAYRYDASGANGNLASCSALCLADFKCMAFAFTSIECLLYPVPASGNFYPLASSPYLFYDRTCVATPTTTSSSLTTSTSTTPTPTPTQTFCLQATGSGRPGKGYYAYTGPTSLGNGLYISSSTTNITPTQLFYISAPFGVPFLYDLKGNRVEFLDRPSDPAPPQVQPLIWVGQITPGDQEDYQVLNCSVGQYSALQCAVGAQGSLWNQWAVVNASFVTEQRLYLQTATATAGMDQIGLTVVDQSLCPVVPVASN